MIVKNEAHVIQRCLRSVKPFIDSYSISDTGSTDNTMELIREELVGMPGVLTSDPWQDFATNRNLALSRCTGDYILTIDSDDTLEYTGPMDDQSPPIELSPEYDSFQIRLFFPTFFYWQTKIIRNDPRWKWEGKVHEVLMFDGNAVTGRLDNLSMRIVGDGNRSQLGDKSLRDLAVLENDEPTPRNVFYHAQTLWDLGRYEEAAKKYYERAAMGGWEEEVYYSLWRGAESLNILERPLDEVGSALFRAYLYRPARREALNSLCRVLRLANRWEECYLLSSIAHEPPASDVLFLDTNAEWLILEEHALAAWYLGKKEESHEYFLRVAEYDLPDNARERTNENLSYFS